MLHRITVTGGVIHVIGVRTAGATLEVYTGGTGIRVPLLRNEVRELRDALNETLGEPHVTGDEVHNVASVARDLALEEAAKLADHGGTEGQSSHLTAKYVAECIRQLKGSSHG